MSHNQQTPPKRPRLSLQIKALSSGPNLRASRTIAAVVNPTSPTSFNTLSNVYATAIDRSTPVTAINTKQQPLTLQTNGLAKQPQDGPQPTPHGAQPTPFASTYPDTPLTAQPVSPAVANRQDFRFPSSMTATPPLSAGPVDSSSSSGGENKVFSFHPTDTTAASSSILSPGKSGPNPSTGPAPEPTRRRATAALCVSRPALALPYTRNRSLHSILRNSPLPPPTAKTPISPRRQSARLADKASRRVCYHSPIEQEIINDQYVRSHIDLLLEPSPASATSSPVSPSSLSSLVTTPSTTSAGPLDETTTTTTASFMLRDGGMTPGPFEEMRRRMAGLGTRSSPTSPAGSPVGIRKRRRKERSRRWVWTIGTQEGAEDGEEEDDEAEVGGALAALRAAAKAQQQQAATSPAAAAATTSSAGGAKPTLRPLVTVAAPVLESPMEIVTPSIETFDEQAQAQEEEEDDVLMYESEPDADTAGELVLDQRRALSLTPGEMDFEMVTPTVTGGGGSGSGMGSGSGSSSSHHHRLQPFHFAGSMRQDSEGLFNPETGSRRDTPVPAELVAVE